MRCGSGTDYHGARWSVSLAGSGAAPLCCRNPAASSARATGQIIPLIAGLWCIFGTSHGPMGANTPGEGMSAEPPLSQAGPSSSCATPPTELKDQLCFWVVWRKEVWPWETQLWFLPVRSACHSTARQWLGPWTFSPGSNSEERVVVPFQTWPGFYKSQSE